MNSVFFGPLSFILQGLPPIVKIVVGILFGLLAVILIFKIIKMILDAIPFV